MRLSHISKTYHNIHGDTLALNDVSLNIPSKGMTFILGPSGCGKTTLLNIISGRDKDYEGELILDGSVECISQEILLMENLSIMDNLLLVSNNKKQINDFLSRFSLTQPSKKVKKLSGGEKKRVQVIRSLLSSADYFICDEPTASLDYDNRTLIMDVLKDLSKNKGIIIVTHEIALVDSYADGLVRMGKGCIIDSKVDCDDSISTITQKSNPSIQKHLWMTRKLFKRHGETSIRLFLLFCMSMLIFTMIFLYPSLSQSMQAKTNWKYAKNVVSPVAVNGEKSQFSNGYMYYDLYQKDDLNLLREKEIGVIGYQLGWDFHAYENHTPGCSFIPFISLDALKEVVKQYEDEKPHFMYFDEMKQAAEAGVPEFPNYMYFRGYNSTNGFGGEPITQYLTIANQDVICYQLFDDVSLPLIEGHMPTRLNEIAINQDLAKDLMRYFKFENITDLIGKEVNLNHVRFLYDSSSPYKEYPVIISGISYMECELENQVYFKDGGFDKIFVDEFGSDPSIATYQYMHLLIDPSLNVEKVSDQINTLLQSKNSRFMSLGTMKFSKENFQDMNILMIFFLFASIVVMMMYLLMHLLLNKRMTKEQHILSSYNYHPYPMTVCMLMVLCLIVAGLQSLFLESVCGVLNQWLNQLGFQSIFSYRFDYALLSLTLTFVFFAILEVILYVFRTKQH